MTAAEIALALGPARRSGTWWWRTVCPAHHSRTGHSLTLALRDHPRGLAVHCHAGCSRDDIIVALRARGLIGERGDWRQSLPVPRSDHNTNGDDTAHRVALARRIWDRAQDALRSPVPSYLGARGITMPVPQSLRWAPRCWHSEANRCRPACQSARQRDPGSASNRDPSGV
jgi:hypothetical protein